MINTLFISPILFIPISEYSLLVFQFSNNNNLNKKRRIPKNVTNEFFTFQLF